MSMSTSPGFGLRVNALRMKQQYFTALLITLLTAHFYQWTVKQWRKFRRHISVVACIN